MRHIVILFLAVSLSPLSNSTQLPKEDGVEVAAAPGDSVPLYDNLGDHHYPITTASPMAQRYFDQGLRLYYAFNHSEAIRAFREAQRRDPTCAMCQWGEALAWGPNINLPMDSAAGVAAYAAASRAQRALGPETPAIERALIDALTLRYGAAPTVDRAARDSAFAKAMVQVHTRFPDDPEAAVLSAEARMDLRPWNYWTAERTLQPGMAGVLASLEQVMESRPTHPGACHFFIHAVEAVEPQRAVACAEQLATLMPGAGHLVHMPGHIYIRVGRYLEAIEANRHAVHADETYIRDQRPGGNMYTLGYYPHNYDFMAFAASMAGKETMAIDAADKLASLTAPEMMRAPGMAFLQHHATRRLQFRVRFERWQEILDTPMPDADLKHARAMWHYAHGRAAVATSDLMAAERDLKAVREAVDDPALQGLRLEFNESPAILSIAQAVLTGTLASARGQHGAAITHLKRAVALEDALTYGEPPDWSVAVRQDLGAALLAAGKPAEAQQVFRADLQRFPKNVRSEEGLRAAERALR